MDKDHTDLNDNVVSLTGETALAGGHATHVAGIIAAEGNNNKGVTGLNWTSSLRIYEFGGISAVKAQEAMVRAVNDGVRIVNMSLQWIDNNGCGIVGTDDTLKKVAENNALLGRAILYAERQNKDVLWVFAAGNECRDAKFASPASLSRDFPLNTITVAAIQEDGNILGLSNFGSLVTVAAPGGNILSTVPRSCPTPSTCTDQYKPKSGTSMAAPHVTGLAGLVLSHHPNFSAVQIKNCILSAAQTSGASVTGHNFKVINALEAVKCEGSVALPAKVDLIFSIDLTSSMNEEIARVKIEIANIISNLKTRTSPSTDFRFGVVSHQDYNGSFDSRPCGSAYSARYGSGSDVAFRLDQALTVDEEAVKNAVLNLAQGSGDDNPESYGRVFWELGQNDTGATLGWRSDALKLVVDFGDDVPHDRDLNQGVKNPPFSSFDTGIDPGRNNIIDCGGDDIDFQDSALAALSSKGIHLLHIDSSGNAALAPYYQFWTSLTGGAFAAINPDGTVPGGINLTELIENLLRLIPSQASTSVSMPGSLAGIADRHPRQEKYIEDRVKWFYLNNGSKKRLGK